jgi:hypothetical protein
MGMGNAKPSKQAEGARCRRHRQAGAGGVCALCLQERLARLALSASVPSVVRGCDEEGASSSYCSEASTAYSSEGSTSCSSAGAESPSGRGHGPGFFLDEMRRAGRASLLMRHERVVGDADAVAEFLQARREQRRRAAAATGFWAKLLRATRGGAGERHQQQDDGCSLAHSKTAALQERVAAAKWVLF